ncbi:hypothetical protein MHYP_G00124360 [Metynnis hypsauchen]
MTIYLNMLVSKTRDSRRASDYQSQVQGNALMTEQVRKGTCHLASPQLSVNAKRLVSSTGRIIRIGWRRDAQRYRARTTTNYSLRNYKSCYLDCLLIHKSSPFCENEEIIIGTRRPFLSIPNAHIQHPSRLCCSDSPLKS